MIIDAHAKGGDTRHIDDAKSIRLSRLEVKCGIDMVIDQARFYSQESEIRQISDKQCMLQLTRNGLYSVQVVFIHVLFQVCV